MFEDATLFGGVRLDPQNKWVRMCYHRAMISSGTQRGYMRKSAR